jgi:hypothetical protein
MKRYSLPKTGVSAKDIKAASLELARRNGLLDDAPSLVELRSNSSREGGVVRSFVDAPSRLSSTKKKAEAA